MREEFSEKLGRNIEELIYSIKDFKEYFEFRKMISTELWFASRSNDMLITHGPSLLSSINISKLEIKLWELIGFRGK